MGLGNFAVLRAATRPGLILLRLRPRTSPRLDVILRTPSCGKLVKSGGEGGIRTPGRSFGPYNGLANRRIQPLCHLSAACFQQLTTLP